VLLASVHTERVLSVWGSRSREYEALFMRRFISVRAPLGCLQISQKEESARVRAWPVLCGRKPPVALRGCGLLGVVVEIPSALATVEFVGMAQSLLAHNICLDTARVGKWERARRKNGDTEGKFMSMPRSDDTDNNIGRLLRIPRKEDCGLWTTQDIPARHPRTPPNQRVWACLRSETWTHHQAFLQGSRALEVQSSCFS
jgi:hypothetical protein